MLQKIIKKALILTILLMSIAQAVTIKSIKIIGLNVVPRGTVLNYIPVEVGDEYTDQVSDTIIKQLYKTDFFKNIEVTLESQALKINVEENPHIKVIRIINYSNKVIKKRILEPILKNMNLYKGKIFSEKQLDRLIKQLKNTYITKGYYSVKINKKTRIDNQNRISITIDINEGNVAIISSMKITGAKAIEQSELMDLFEIRPLFLPFLASGFSDKNNYSKAALDAGIEAMKSFYINSGFLDFKVKDVSTTLTNEGKNINIDIKIDEGAAYKINKIKFSGTLLDVTKDKLHELLAISKGDTFNRKKIIEGSRNIRSIFAEQGYAFVKVVPKIVENRKTYLIDLNFKISVKNRVYINRITITGNTRTQDHVIRRKINIAEGGLFSNKEINASTRNIKRLKFFSKVKAKKIKVKGEPDKIDINFDVKEKKTGSFTIGASGSSSTGASFNLGIKEKNFLGTGNAFNAAFVLAKEKKTIDVFFSDPYFTKDGHNISYGVFFKSTGEQDLPTDAYLINRTGFNLGYGFPLTKTTRLNNSVSISNRAIQCGEQYAIDNGAQCNTTDRNEIRIRTRWNSSTVNNNRNPTMGQKNRVSFEVALPIADLRYYKLDINHKSYYPLTKKLTLRVSSTLGISQSYDDKILPPDKRYKGGSNKVRGIEFKELTGGGGKLLWLAGASIVYPLDFITDSEDVDMRFFLDSGSVEEEIRNFGDELRMSIGVILEWTTPIGPLGVYFAKPIIKQDGDIEKPVEFVLGTAF